MIHSRYMAKHSTKQILAKNLTFLMSQAGHSQHELAKRSGVSQKTISNILRQEQAAAVEMAEKLAAAFGLEGWHIIMPNLPTDLLAAKSMEALYASYIAASIEGRANIERIAEMEAKYSND